MLPPWLRADETQQERLGVAFVFSDLTLQSYSPSDRWPRFFEYTRSRASWKREVHSLLRRRGIVSGRRAWQPALPSTQGRAVIGWPIHPIPSISSWDGLHSWGQRRDAERVREQSELADFRPPGTPATPLPSLTPSRLWIQPTKLSCHDISYMLPSCSSLPSTALSRMADLWLHTSLSSSTQVLEGKTLSTPGVWVTDSKSCGRTETLKEKRSWSWELVKVWEP